MLSPLNRKVWNFMIGDVGGELGADCPDIGVVLWAVDAHMRELEAQVAALEAQLAEARRLIARYAMPFDPMVAKLECLSCGYRVSADAPDAVVADHIGDCPVGAFLAATVGTP